MPTLEELEAKYFVSGAGVPHVRDTEVIPHVDAESYFAAIYEAIDATGKTGDVIYIASWRFSSALVLKPGVSPPLGRLLHDKALQGVDVRAVVWAGRFLTGHGTLDDSSFWDTTFANTAQGAQSHLAEIVQFNILDVRRLRKLNPTRQSVPPLQGRLLMDPGGGAFGSRHQKYTVVYRKDFNDLRAFVGGMDFSELVFGAPHHAANNWHDAGVELRAGAAASVWTDFRTRWVEAQKPSRRLRQGAVELFNDPALITSPTVPVAPEVIVSPVTGSVRVLRSYWNWKESPLSGPDIPWETVSAEGVKHVFQVYAKALNNATSFIYVEDQYLNRLETEIDHDLLFPLIANAANRGVKVIFIVPGRGDPQNPATLENQLHSRDLEGELLTHIDDDKRDNFVMYRVDGVFVHAKVLIVDDEFMAIGSSNFANRSMEGRDTELQTAIIDPDRVKRFRVQLWADHLRVDPLDPTVSSELLEPSKFLGLFDDDWGSGVTFDHENSKFGLVRPRP